MKSGSPSNEPFLPLVHRGPNVQSPHKKIVIFTICKYSQLHMSVMHDHEHELKAHTRRHDSNKHTTRVVALPQSHPGLCGTPVGPGKDTHGTPVPEQGRPWVARRNLHETTTDNTTDKVLRQTCFQETSADRPLYTYMVPDQRDDHTAIAQRDNLYDLDLSTESKW